MVYTAEASAARSSASSRSRPRRASGSYDARTGRPVYQRIKVLDQIEHPSLRPGKPVVDLPLVARRPELLALLLRPDHRLRLQRPAETASVVVQAKLTPAEQERKLLRATSSSASPNGNFGQYLKGWHDYGSVSAIDAATGQVAWKFVTPEPERGGVTTTASGLGFVGGGDGVLRAFDTKTGTILWHFQTGHQIAAGADGLRDRRQGVRRDHERRHADLVERRLRVGARRVRARRQPEGAAAAGRRRDDGRRRQRRRWRRSGLVVGQGGRGRRVLQPRRAARAARVEQLELQLRRGHRHADAQRQARRGRAREGRRLPRAEGHRLLGPLQPRDRRDDRAAPPRERDRREPRHRLRARAQRLAARRRALGARRHRRRLPGDGTARAHAVGAASSCRAA